MGEGVGVEIVDFKKIWVSVEWIFWLGLGFGRKSGLRAR